MTVTNVSTYGSLQTLLQNMSRVQGELAGSQQQISSGLKSQTFEGLNGSIEQYTSLSAQVARLKDFEESNSTVQARLQSTGKLLGQMLDVTQALKNLTVSQISNTQSPAAFEQQVKSNRDTLVSLLNSTFQGSYIFSGTRTDTPPVKTPLPAPATVGVPDNGYYQGTTKNPSARISDSQEISYDIRADDPAFQRIFAGIDQALKAAGSVDQMKAAQDLIGSGLQDIITLQSRVNSHVVTLQQITAQSQTLRTYYKGLTDELVSADLVSLSTKVVQDQAILQASFSTYARISQLTLANYLK